MTTNRFDKGLFDTIKEHNAIAIAGEAETRAAMADMKTRLEYDQRRAAWQKQKRITWIPLGILAVALLSQMSNIEYGGGSTRGLIAIVASIVMLINFGFAWKFIYIMFSRATGVPPVFWNLATFAAIPIDQLEPAEKGLTQMSSLAKMDLIKFSAISLVGGSVSWFMSFANEKDALMFFFLGGIAWGFWYLKAMIEILVAWSDGPFFFPERAARRVNRAIEAAWRRNPAAPTVSRRSLAGKIVLAVRGWRTKHQGQGGGTEVRTA